MSERPRRPDASRSTGGKRVVLGVLALAVLLTAAVVLQAVFSERTSITHRGLTTGRDRGAR